MIANGDCPVGARNAANIDNVNREVADMSCRLRTVELDLARMKTQIAMYAGLGAFLSTLAVQVAFKLIG